MDVLLRNLVKCPERWRNRGSVSVKVYLLQIGLILSVKKVANRLARDLVRVGNFPSGYYIQCHSYAV